MDRVPVFSLVRETMPAVTVEGFRGIINTTCNYLLTELERGVPFETAIAEMQARGIAEADPSLDVDGWDAAAKTAALVNVLMGGAMTPHDVVRSGIREISAQEARGNRARAPGAARRLGIAARAAPRRAGGAGSSMPATRSPPWAVWRTRSTSTICSATSASCSAPSTLTQTACAAQRRLEYQLSFERFSQSRPIELRSRCR